jgi:hypothetical protein
MTKAGENLAGGPAGPARLGRMGPAAGTARCRAEVEAHQEVAVLLGRPGP